MAPPLVIRTLRSVGGVPKRVRRGLPDLGAGVPGRADMVYGITKPTTDLVGLPAATKTIDDSTSPIYFTESNVPSQPIKNVLFRRRVVIQTDLSFERLGFRAFQECAMVGPSAAPSADSSLVDCTNAAAKAGLLDCLLKPQVPSIWWNGINGHDFINERFLVENCVDAHGVYNTTVPTASRPYNSGVQLLGGIAWKPYFGLQSAQPDGVTHNDTLAQLQGGRYTLIRGCLARAQRDSTMGEQGDYKNAAGQNAFYNGRVLSCVLFNNNVGDSAFATVDSNWFESAYFAVTAAGISPTNAGSIINNRFDGTSGSRDINLSSAQGAVDTSGNLRYDGSAITNPRNG